MSTQKTGATLYFLASVGAIALLAWLFSAALDEQRNPNRDVVSNVLDDGTTRVVLARNRAGHYVASGRVNAVAAEFIIDTGATDVAVSAALASAAGLERGAPHTVLTANGQVTAYSTRIERLALGDLVEYDVRATIVPDMQAIDVLLGMSFLRRLDFAQRGDELWLEQRRTGERAL